jgi:hypothetical protein
LLGIGDVHCINCSFGQRAVIADEASPRPGFFSEHDLFEKPMPTHRGTARGHAFPDHAPDQTTLRRRLQALCCAFQNRRRTPTLRKAHSTRFAARRSHGMTNNRNVLYLIIGVLVVALGVVGYNLYQAKKEPEGLQINVGPNGLKIQNK